MHCEFRSQVFTTAPVELFEKQTHFTMEVGPSAWREAVVDDVWVQGVKKRIPAGGQVSQRFVGRTALDELVPPGKRLENLFHVRQVDAHGGRDHCGKKGRTGDARRLEKLLFVRSQSTKSVFDKVADRRCYQG